MITHFNEFVEEKQGRSILTRWQESRIMIYHSQIHQRKNHYKFTTIVYISNLKMYVLHILPYFVQGKPKKLHCSAFSPSVVTIYRRAKLSITLPRSNVCEHLNIKKPRGRCCIYFTIGLGEVKPLVPSFGHH